MPNWHAVTTTGAGILRVLRSDCEVTQGHAPTVPLPSPWCKFTAIWDTGAEGCVITDAVVQTCGLKPIGMIMMHGVHGSAPAEQFLVNLRLPNGVGFPNVRVTKGNLVGGAEILLGMDVITTGDFSITNFSGKTVFSFRVPTQKHVDFVALHAMERLKETQHHGSTGPRRPNAGKSFGKKKKRK